MALESQGYATPLIAELSGCRITTGCCRALVAPTYVCWVDRGSDSGSPLSIRAGRLSGIGTAGRLIKVVYAGQEEGMRHVIRHSHDPEVDADYIETMHRLSVDRNSSSGTGISLSRRGG